VTPAFRGRVVLAALWAALAALPATGQELAGGGAAPAPLRQGPPGWWASAAVGLGPLMQSSQSPASIFRLSHPVGMPAVLSAGQWEVITQSDWANYFCEGGDKYFLDFESFRWRFGLAYGLDGRTQLGVSTSASYQGGGVLDGFVEGFERWVGAINEDRRRAPRDRYLLRLRGEDGVVREFGGRDSGWHVECFSLGLLRQLLPGTSTTPSLTASLVVKTPIAREVWGRPENGVDVGLGLHAAQRLGRFHFYSSLGAVHFGTSRSLGVRLVEYQLSFIHSVEYRATPATSLVAQVLLSGPVAYHFGEFSDRSREVALGLKHMFSRHFLLEVSVVENILAFSNSADVAFHTTLAWRP